jgi:hypothetical protein
MTLTKEQIDFLNEVCIGEWSLNENGEIDVDGSVDMVAMDLTEIPIKFGNVDGTFHCSSNNLTTLKNCPVVTYDIFCYGNNLTEYFKSLPVDSEIWDKLALWDILLPEYPFLINIGKKYLVNGDLIDILEGCPQTKIYLK